MEYYFEWDPKKAKKNIHKHKVSFQRAATIFRDPNMISIFDDEHSENEERWITIGIDGNGILLVVSHIFQKINKYLCNIRIISARKAVIHEINQYKDFGL